MSEAQRAWQGAEGEHRGADGVDIRAGFHPSFVMKVLGERTIADVAIEEWLARLPEPGIAPGHEVTEARTREGRGA